MIENTLINKFPAMGNLSASRISTFTEYFSNAPLWLLDNMTIVEIEKGSIFIKEGEVASNIYFLVTGVVEAIDLRVYGEPFYFKEFSDIQAFGGMETLLGEKKYFTTLQTATKCMFLKMPKSIFERWINTDISALMREAKLTIRNLLDEGRNNRLLLFTQGDKRLSLLLIKQYNSYNIGGTLIMNYNRQKIADATGISVKTVSRVIKSFIEKGLVTKENNTLIINKQQCQDLEKSISNILDL